MYDTGTRIQTRIRRLFSVFMWAFIGLAIGLAYIVGWRGDYLATHVRNPRQIAIEKSIERGGIYAANGEALAGNRPFQKPHDVQRPHGDAARRDEGSARVYFGPTSLVHIVGYNHDRYGKTGVELAFNHQLLGLPRGFLRTPGLIPGLGFGSRQPQGVKQRGKPRGNDIILTIDPQLQAVAEAALGHRNGAVVVLDPATGAVLASASYPAFDANRLDVVWPDIIQDPSSPFINRATSGLYPPGSVFKIIVASAAIETGLIGPNDIFVCSGSIDVNGRKISCPGGRAHGRVNLASALALSCNVAFIQVARKIGGKTLSDFARRFGFNREIPFDLHVNESRFPAFRGEGSAGGSAGAGDGARDDENLLAEAAIGQGTVLATPLHMAMIASAIANRGVMMRPYVVSQVRRGGSGETLWRYVPARLARPVSVSTAAKVKDLLVAAVESGTGWRAGLDGMSVAGKTGTAQNPKGAPHAWFVGFAPAANPRVAISVIVENGGAGGSVAAPIARRVLDFALRREE
ncbi:MAG TPA: peptidoglycan glycosyltransferase [Firmicutes bacterium]|nr:peptidoglycan glycosyltransferase [Bacillota bacterium]